MEDDDAEILAAQVKKLFAEETIGRAWIVGTWALLETCLELLKDDPRFAAALQKHAGRRAAQALNSPMTDAPVNEVLKIIEMLVPGEYRHLVQDPPSS